MRNIVKVVKLDDVIVHSNADKLEIAIIGGWRVIVKKGEFSKGDYAVFFEVDSFLPKGNPNWEFLMERSTRTYLGVEGHVLKSIRLRKELSQGLVLPMSALNGIHISEYEDDLASVLEVSLYEPPLPSGNLEAKGNFPSWIIKTSEERCQNLKQEIENDWKDTTLFFREKLDGSSFTAYVKDGVFGVCSRNLELKLEASNPWCDIARQLDLESKMKDICDHAGFSNLVIQGELVGSGMNGNKYKLADRILHLFTAQQDGVKVSSMGAISSM